MPNKTACCEKCWKYNGDPDGNVGGFYVCSDPLCHCHQTESIEWEKKFEKAKGTFEVYGEFGMGIDYKKLKEAFSKAITTAVAKRELEIAEEVENMAGWNYDGTKAGNRDCPLIHREAVISIIKH